MVVIAKSNTGSIVAVRQGKSLRIEIDGYIGKWDDASTHNIKQRIAEAGKGATHCELYVNSEGGSVFEANEIENIIKDTFKTVSGTIGAIAASAGSYFLTAFSFTAKKNSQIMIHKPMAGFDGTAEQIRAQVKLLDNLEKHYKKAYAEKMCKTEAEVEKMWANDYWMNAEEALELGLIDAIEDDTVVIDDKLTDRLVACGAPVDNLPATEPKKKNMDINLLRAELGLPTSAGETEVLAKLKEVKQAADKASQLEATIKAQAEAEKKAKVKALLDEAEKHHKINAQTRAHYEKLAGAGFDQVKAIIDDLPALDQAPSAGVHVDGKGTAAHANWTYADYAEKDPEAFEKLPEEKQQALLGAHYGK